MPTPITTCCPPFVTPERESRFFSSSQVCRCGCCFKKDEPFLTYKEIYAGDNYLLKISIVGPPQAGKSCLLRTLAGEDWSGPYVETIGVDFRTLRSVAAADPSDGAESAATAQLQLWDTAGSPRFDKLVGSYIRTCFSGAIIAFDATSADSLGSVRSYWLGQVEAHAPPGAVRLLVGMKADLADCEGSVCSEAQSFAHAHGMRFVLLSSSDPTAARAALESLVREIVARLAARTRR